ncbi:hypothetical protein LCGC14_2565920, partial [marine sediment metagenome]
MAIEFTDNSYNPCDSPVCDDLIGVYLISYPSDADYCGTIRVDWRATGLDTG